MITENLSTLKIHKLTQAQYDRELEAGRIDQNALYLTPYDDSPSGPIPDITYATDDELITMLITFDMFPIVVDIEGGILADENNNILLW